MSIDYTYKLKRNRLHFDFIMFFTKKILLNVILFILENIEIVRYICIFTALKDIEKHMP